MNQIFFILGLLGTGVVFLSNVVADGLAELFLLPLSFSIAMLFSKNAVGYLKDSFGLSILYALLILRYLISPMLIARSGTLISNVSTSPTGLRFAVFVMILELFVVVIAINATWKPVSVVFLGKSSSEFKVTWLGALVCLFLGSLLLYRGTLKHVVDHLSFGNWYTYADDSELKTYDMSTALLLKSFLYLVLVAWIWKEYQQSRGQVSKVIWMLVAVLAALCNAMVYQAANRASMVMGALASLSVLLYCFGEKFSRFLPAILVSLVIFVWGLFANGTLGVKEGESVVEKDNFVSEISRVAELYSNGVSMEAHAFDMYDTITSRSGIYTHLSELVNSNNMFTLPGLWLVKDSVESIPSMQSLFNETLDNGDAFILPNAGLALYCGGKYFGLLVDMAFHWLMVWGIYAIYKKRMRSRDLSLVYLYSYSEMILGFVIMNNVMIAVSLLSAFPFLLYVLLKFNKLPKLV